MDIKQLAREYCDACVAVEIAERDGKPILALAKTAMQKREAYLDAKAIQKPEEPCTTN